ncbi:hypothetical protein SAMN04488107_4468 [Geodermatophilus saharensis]|uniref:Uncharacterized protein n=1 Tax=Geodermatophilus saharensis TaxID=1137994 RepID=A0A239IS60_9ACTN|nr:hypothetical protein SAMN04488107_4468 [Geodermatophilus saharensis]
MRRQLAKAVGWACHGHPDSAPMLNEPGKQLLRAVSWWTLAAGLSSVPLGWLSLLQALRPQQAVVMPALAGLLLYVAFPLLTSVGVFLLLLCGLLPPRPVPPPLYEPSTPGAS